jgi:predicted dinucleotide-binding enzyme
MRIAMIGAGQVGRALGGGWTKAGHQLQYGLQDPAGPSYRDIAAGQRATLPAAAAAADAVVLAIPWPAAEAAIRELGSLAGKIVIDCMNPLTTTGGGLGLALGYETSGAERVALWAKGAAVFKALNQTGAENMANAAAFPSKPAMFVAGDDEGRKPAVIGLVRDVGFEAIDAGPLRNARLLEPLAMLWIDQALNRGRGRDFAFALVRRS